MRKKILFQFVLLIGAMTLNAQVTLNDGLVAYYPFNSNANDQSGNGNNGIVYNATLTQDRFGNNNSAYLFNGYSSYISTPVQTGFTNQISLCAWFKTSYNDYGGILCSRTSLNMANDITTDSYGHPAFHLSDGIASNQPYTGISTSNSLNDNNWHMIVGTYDGASMKLYTDGVFQGEVKRAFTIAVGPSFKIGWDELVGYYRYFNGKIDDVLIYNRALNANEVTKLYVDGLCNSSTVNDTIVCSVSSESFKAFSPKYQFLKTDSLKTKVGGCDSVVNRYAKYIYNPNECTVIKTVSVTDTLIIRLVISGTTNLASSVVKIYPNPTKEFLNVDFGDYSKLQGYRMVISNATGGVVYFSSMIQSNALIDIKTWTKGVYIVQILSSSSEIIESKKIIIQ
jgi:hypothetical protein